jgi:hypothetical protein
VAPRADFRVRVALQYLRALCRLGKLPRPIARFRYYDVLLMGLSATQILPAYIFTPHVYDCIATRA